MSARDMHHDCAPNESVIYVIKGQIHTAVDGAMAALTDPAAGVYARGDDLVRVVLHVTPQKTLSLTKQGDNVERPNGAVVITVLTEAALIETLTRHAQFVKMDNRAGKFVPCDCPADVARMILANKGHGWTVPRLRAVISAPTFRQDGTILSETGFDTSSGLLLAGDQLWPSPPELPTKRDAQIGLGVLLEVIGGFPFVDDTDRAAALALLITSVMRPSLKTVPMFAITAPAAGTGKSLLVDIAATMATGRKAAVITPTRDEVELEKRIGAVALAGDSIISIDNVTHILKSDQLCQMLSQEEVQVRVLGSSKSVRIPSTGLICATGNNLAIHGDLNRRTIRIRLDAKHERPDERQFDFDATALASRNRPKLVTAALTVVKAYLDAGAPMKASPMGSFEDWSDTVRSALLWLGHSDCRGDVSAMRADDPEKAELAEIIDALPTGRFTVKDVARKIGENQALQDSFEAFIVRGIFSSKKFGHYLKRHTKTIVDGRYIEQVSNDGRLGSVWRVCSVDGDLKATEW